MCRIHPTESKIDVGERATRSNSPSVWTVWNKSCMAFPGTDGFSVYDSNGRLAFRVDNYSRRHKCFTGELLLMDGNGRALLALRPQVGLGNHVILASHMLYSVEPYREKAVRCSIAHNKRRRRLGSELHLQVGIIVDFHIAVIMKQ